MVEAIVSEVYELGHQFTSSGHELLSDLRKTEPTGKAREGLLAEACVCLSAAYQQKRAQVSNAVAAARKWKELAQHAEACDGYGRKELGDAQARLAAVERERDEARLAVGVLLERLRAIEPEPSARSLFVSAGVLDICAALAEEYVRRREQLAAQAPVIEAARRVMRGWDDGHVPGMYVAALVGSVRAFAAPDLKEHEIPTRRPHSVQCDNCRGRLLSTEHAARGGRCPWCGGRLRAIDTLENAAAATEVKP